MTPPRIPALPPGEWPEAMGAALAALRPENPRHPFPSRDADRPKGLNVLGTLAQHPDLARAFHTLVGHVLFATTITSRQRELVVLRVAALRSCGYEWAQHAVIAGDEGITPDELDRVVVGSHAPGWAPGDQALLRATEELVRDAQLTDDTWAALTDHLDHQQVMDVVFTVGTYDVLAMAMNAFGVELDADLERKPASP